VRALHLEGRTPRIVERDRPEPGEGDALVRVALAGVCNRAE
jgi:D-arabinose 1-dehydrogenase-like Zn-dependent alcohol dehydrogenase